MLFLRCKILCFQNLHLRKIIIVIAWSILFMHLQNILSIIFHNPRLKIGEFLIKFTAFFSALISFIEWKSAKVCFRETYLWSPLGCIWKKIFVSYYEVTFQDFSSYVTGLPRLPDSIIYSILMSYPILQQSRRIQ